MDFQALFVAGTDTDIGKTVVSGLLACGREAYYWKPIQAGSAYPMDSDTVANWIGRERIVEERYCLSQPVSPHLAAVILEPLFQGGEPRARWETIAAIHRAHLDNLAGREIIKDLRSCGTVAAIEFDSADGGYLDALAPEIHRTALENGVLLRPLGNILYVLPPYAISEEQLHRVWNVVEKCIAVAEAVSVRGKRPLAQPIAPMPGG